MTCSFRLQAEDSWNNVCRMKRNSLIQLILIHYREFIREPGILFWSIIFPVLMAWVLGIALC